MRTLASLFTVVLLFASVEPVPAQRTVQHVDLEVEPLAYTFGGAGGNVGLQVGDWKYEIEAFGLRAGCRWHTGRGNLCVSP